MASTMVAWMHHGSSWLKIILAASLVAASCTSNTADSTTTTALGTVENSDQVIGLRGGGFTAPEVDDTALEISDDIRMGVLDNGLTYYVRSNDSPGQSVSIRLAVKAGAYHEDPQGTGVAHFLEHMMFNGTEAYPGNQVDSVLRSIGAEIGPDFNAYTSATETVYQISLEDRDNSVETALDVLVQWATAATLDPGEVSAEAPIVREELRLGESGEGLVAKRFDEIYHDGTPFEGVDTGGTAESIDAITPEVLRSYYDTWYRPDNMAIILVGDRSTRSLESLVKTKFDGFEARGSAPDSSIESVPLRAEPYVEVFVEQTFGDAQVSIDVPVPEWDLGTRGGQEQWVTEVLLGIMISSRISEGVQTGRLDLIQGGGNWFNYDRGLQYIGFNVSSDDLEDAAEILLTEIEASIKTGFDEGELERAVDIWRNFQDQRLQGKSNIPDSEWANAILEDFLGTADLQSIDDSVEMNLDIVDGLNIAEVNNHWGWAMTSAEPLILTIAADEETGGDASELLAALQRARAADAAALEDNIEEIATLMKRPAGVREVGRKDLRANDGIELEFENGMRVLISESDIAENDVSFVSSSPGGRAKLDDVKGALAGVAVDAVNTSGVGEYSAVQIGRYLSDIDVGLGAYVSDFDEGFSGGAATEDLEVLFQLVHLAISEPLVEEVPFAQQQERYRDQLEFSTLDSTTAADAAFSDARTGGGRFAYQPTKAQINGLDADEALSIYQDRFGSLDDHVIVIVGDVDEDVVTELARSYIGTLPAQSADAPSDGLLAPGTVAATTNVGDGETAGSYRYLSVGTADETTANLVLADVATSYLNDQAFAIVREELGATYGGRAGVSFNDPGDSVDLVISVDGDPSRVDEIGDVVNDLLEAVANGQINDDDFLEAVTVVRSRYNFINNGFIIQSLFDEAGVGGGGNDIIGRFAQQEALDRVTPAKLAAFIQSLTSGPDKIEVKNKPG